MCSTGSTATNGGRHSDSSNGGCVGVAHEPEARERDVVSAGPSVSVKCQPVVANVVVAAVAAVMAFATYVAYGCSWQRVTIQLNERTNDVKLLSNTTDYII